MHMYYGDIGLKRLLGLFESTLKLRKPTYTLLLSNTTLNSSPYFKKNYPLKDFFRFNLSHVLILLRIIVITIHGNRLFLLSLGNSRYPQL